MGFSSIGVFIEVLLWLSEGTKSAAGRSFKLGTPFVFF